MKRLDFSTKKLFSEIWEGRKKTLRGREKSRFSRLSLLQITSRWRNCPWTNWTYIYKKRPVLEFLILKGGSVEFDFGLKISWNRGFWVEISQKWRKQVKNGCASSWGYFQISFWVFLIISDWFLRGVIRVAHESAFFALNLSLRIYGSCVHEFQCVGLQCYAIPSVTGFCEFFSLPSFRSKLRKKKFPSLTLIQIISERCFLVYECWLCFSIMHSCGNFRTSQILP